MPVYLTVTYEYESVEDVANDGLPGDNALGYIREPVRNTPPVVLSGLVKGGEIATAAEYEMSPTLPRHFVLLVDASGRVVADRAGVGRALRMGAFPLTWYRYEEA
jgi:hypothetical protein